MENGKRMNNTANRHQNTSGHRHPLWEDILSFSRNKYSLALTLIAVGLLGIIIPIIPGLLLFILALALVRKGWASRFRRRWRLWQPSR